MGISNLGNPPKNGNEEIFFLFPGSEMGSGMSLTSWGRGQEYTTVNFQHVDISKREDGHVEFWNFVTHDTLHQRDTTPCVGIETYIYSLYDHDCATSTMRTFGIFIHDG